jgi:hypothetical protein
MQFTWLKQEGSLVLFVVTMALLWVLFKFTEAAGKMLTSVVNTLNALI